MIKEAHAILHITDSTLQHIFQEANQCVDHLTRIGAEHGEDLMVTAAQPLSFREFWIALT